MGGVGASDSDPFRTWTPTLGTPAAAPAPAAPPQPAPAAGRPELPPTVRAARPAPQPHPEAPADAESGGVQPRPRSHLAVGAKRGIVQAWKSLPLYAAWQLAPGQNDALAAGMAKSTVGLAESALRTPESVRRFSGFLIEACERYGVPVSGSLRGLELLARLQTEGVSVGGAQVGSTALADALHDRAAEAMAAHPLFQRLEAKGAAADAALRTALNSGDLGDLASLAADPESWAGLVGQSMPALALAYLSGGGVPLLALLEASGVATDARDFERRTGVAVTDEQFTRALAQTVLINAILQKASLSRLLAAGKAPGVGTLAIASGSESAGSAAQQLNANLAARAYDEGRDVSQGVVGAALGGFGSSGLLGTIRRGGPAAHSSGMLALRPGTAGLRLEILRPLESVAGELRAAGVRLAIASDPEQNVGLVHILPEGNHRLNRLAAGLTRMDSEIKLGHIPLLLEKSGSEAGYVDSDKIVLISSNMALGRLSNEGFLANYTHEARHARNALRAAKGEPSPYLGAATGKLPGGMMESYSRYMSFDEPDAYRMNMLAGLQGIAQIIVQNPDARFSFASFRECAQEGAHVSARSSVIATEIIAAIESGAAKPVFARENGVLVARVRVHGSGGDFDVQVPLVGRPGSAGKTARSRLLEQLGWQRSAAEGRLNLFRFLEAESLFFEGSTPAAERVAHARALSDVVAYRPADHNPTAAPPSLADLSAKLAELRRPTR